MPDSALPEVARLRDSTQILLTPAALEGIEAGLRERCTVTIRREGDRVRIIGSPTEIKDASRYLSRNGVTIA